VIGRTRCRATEDQIVRMMLGTLPVTERVDLERHLGVCARCARTLLALEAAGSAYDQAFARLRSRGVLIAPGRARLAAARERRVGLAIAIPAQLLRLRLAEATLAFGVMTMAVVGSLAIEPSPATPPSPEPAVLVAPAVAAPQPEDPQRIRAARLRYGDVSVDLGDMVFRVTPGSPY
jgi:anti-sigma factor RsiW